MDEIAEKDKTSKREPAYPSDLHSDVVGECQKEWANGRPWTNIRVLRKGVDNLSSASCSYWGGCSKKVEAVQYNSTFGEPQFYCEDHAVVQQERDVFHYDSKPRPVPDLTPAERTFIQKLLTKKKKKDERTDGPKEENDL